MERDITEAIQQMRKAVDEDNAVGICQASRLLNILVIEAAATPNGVLEEHAAEVKELFDEALTSSALQKTGNPKYHQNVQDRLESIMRYLSPLLEQASARQ